MAIKTLTSAEVTLPDFAPEPCDEAEVFGLSSHLRAREALAFGLAVANPRYNIFVLGEEQSGRLTETMRYIEAAVADRAPPDDWVYLNNFRQPTAPRPYRLPSGIGRALADRLARLVPNLRDALKETLGGEALQGQIEQQKFRAAETINREIEGLRQTARGNGLDILQSPQGPIIVAVGDDGQPVPAERMTAHQSAALKAAGPGLSKALQAIGRRAAAQRLTLQASITELGRTAAANVTAPLLDDLAEGFGKYRGLSHWIVELRNDVIDNFQEFLHDDTDGAQADSLRPERRYAVNVLVDNADMPHSRVVLEANPSYQNLFGRIEYRQGEHAYETDFTMIRPGALHLANQGILILRANAIAAQPELWDALKAALRDGVVHIEEPHRAGALPVAGAPKPVPVPLAVKVVMIASPHWYYAFFSIDPEFSSYFKIKADIDPDMEASAENLRCYAALIGGMARSAGAEIDDAARRHLLGMASRWASDRTKLSSQFERIEDVVVEARHIAGPAPMVTRDHVIQALANRRRRNSRIEDRAQEAIARNVVMIATSGSTIGQINALVVRDMGDHQFGMPSRVTARASVGRHGVINIERDVALGGPLQQKGAMILQGYLAGRFARRFPLSFNCSITFEQNYGGVEGDSASLAELIAILSDLAGVPVRQDLAITGSVNQRGEAQAIGGAHVKVEGFYRCCAQPGPLTGRQGVVLPAANERALILRREIVDAVARGAFHLYSVTSIEEAVELLTGVPVGVPDGAGAYPPDTVFGRVQAQLGEFDEILRERPDRTQLDG